MGGEPVTRRTDRTLSVSRLGWLTQTGRMSLTAEKNGRSRRPAPLTGGYYWFPTRAGDTITWSVLTCHDLGFDPDDGHFDMWPSVIDRLASVWRRDVVRLRRLLGVHCYGLPRGRITRPARQFLVLHGADAPVADWLPIVVERFNLDIRSVRPLYDEHEETFTRDRQAMNAEFGLSVGRPVTEGREDLC